MQFQNILVVCAGNICRSPMAEFLLKHHHPQLNIYSAGIIGLIGQPADTKAIECMQRLNIDMHTHIAQKLNADLVKRADLILVMSHRQQQHIEMTWPFAKGKTFRLGHWRSQNIADPYQHSQSFFDEVCLQIQQCVTDWKKHL